MNNKINFKNNGMGESKYPPGVEAALKKYDILPPLPEPKTTELVNYVIPSDPVSPTVPPPVVPAPLQTKPIQKSMRWTTVAIIGAPVIIIPLLIILLKRR